MHRSSLKRLVVVAGSLGLMACAPAVEGDWETKEKIAGSARRSTMELTADGEGEADIHVVVTDNQGQATCRGDNWGHSRSQTNSIPWKALSPSHSSSSSSLSSQSWRKSSSAMPRPRPLPSSLRSPRSTFREAQRTYEELDRRVREKERSSPTTTSGCASWRTNGSWWESGSGSCERCTTEWGAASSLRCRSSSSPPWTAMRLRMRCAMHWST